MGNMRKIEIAREGSTVIFTVQCTGQYAAMLLYDDAAAKLKNGFLSIEIETALADQPKGEVK